MKKISNKNSIILSYAARYGYFVWVLASSAGGLTLVYIVLG